MFLLTGLITGSVVGIDTAVKTIDKNQYISSNSGGADFTVDLIAWWSPSKWVHEGGIPTVAVGFNVGPYGFGF